MPVGQQPDHDLRVDPPFLAIADLAQAVFVLGLEVQRRHVVQNERDIAAGQYVREAQPGDLVAVAAVRAAGQGPAHRLVAGRLAAQVRQDPAGVQDRGRLDDPGQDQVPEHVIAQGAESQVAENAVQRLEQQPRVGRAPPAAAPRPPGPRQEVPRRTAPALASGVTSRACGAAGSMPRSNEPWEGSASISRARSSRIPSSASVCADPTCATIFRRPPSYSAICTAVAPDAVRTRRIHATAPSLGHQLVPETRPRRRHRSRSETRNLG